MVFNKNVFVISLWKYNNVKKIKNLLWFFLVFLILLFSFSQKIDEIHNSIIIYDLNFQFTKLLKRLISII